MQANQAFDGQDVGKDALNKRFEEIGWGLFLMMIGVIWLVPEAHVPQGMWLIGAGIIMLGLNLVRYLSGVRMSRFTIALGVLALAAGLGRFFFVNLPILAIVLIIIGASITLRPLFGRK